VTLVEGLRCTLEESFAVNQGKCCFQCYRDVARHHTLRGDASVHLHQEIEVPNCTVDQRLGGCVTWRRDAGATQFDGHGC